MVSVQSREIAGEFIKKTDFNILKLYETKVLHQLGTL